MKVLVFGANGALGQEVACQFYNMGVKLQYSNKSDCDITEYKEVRSVLSLTRPTLVINCAGIVKGRPLCEIDYVKTNSLGPHNIAKACDEFKARLIHISTDCVFSGVDNHSKYLESDIPSPTDIYGFSKLAGEVTRFPHLTIRSSFIGFGERGLLAWLLQTDKFVPGYTQSYWNGVTSIALARVIVILGLSENVSGLIHIGREERTSKHDLLNLLVQYLGLDKTVVEVTTPKEYRVDRSLGTYREDVRSLIQLPSLTEMLYELADVYTLRQK